MFVDVDLADASSCRKLVVSASDHYGGVDILVNNAGFQHVSPLEEFQEETWDQMVAVMLTALTLAREYERGSMEQLFATPVGRLEVILGKLAPYFGIGLVQVLLVLVMGVWLFNVPIRGSVGLLFLISSVFLLAMLMQGLLISAATKNQMVASQIAVERIQE